MKHLKFSSERFWMGKKEDSKFSTEKFEREK